MEAKADDKRKDTWVPVAIAALATCAFLSFVALAVAFGGNEPNAAGDAADPPFARTLSSFVIVGMPALAAWGVSINHRCINTTIRRILLVVVVLMGIWLFAACVITVWLDASDPPLVAAAMLSDLGLMLVIETYIDARILPSIHRYRTLFRRLPFDLKILNPGGRVIYKTDTARPLDSTTLWRLSRMEPSETADSAPSVRSEAVADVVFKLYRLSAGTALLTEDASQITKLQRRLEERQDQLKSQNEILKRNHAMQSLLYRQHRERELGERVEHDLASTAAHIRTILDNRIVGTDAVSREDRLQQLNLVKVLVAYSKRKGMLALAAAESETLSSEQLAVVAREARADLNSIGIECAMLVDSRTPISISAFNTIYDCFYDCILSVLPRTNPVIMTYITTLDGGILEMRSVIECAIGLTDSNAVELIPQRATSTESWTAVQMDIARDLEGRFATRGSDFTVTLEEGLVNATVRAVDSTSPTYDLREDVR